MFLTMDRLFRRIRSTSRDEQGATLVVVIALMAVGFIVSALIASACLFAVQQTTSARANVQAFAAAEGGRDTVVAALSDTSELATPCSTPTYTGTDPQYSVTVYSTSDSAMPDNADSMSAACPTTDTQWVVLRSVSDAGGGQVTVDSVYQWVEYRQKVAGGGLGFMDRSYTVQGVSYSGDIIVRDGDFTCSIGSSIDGSVYVLNGNFNVPYSWIDGLTNGGCDVSGDVVVNRKVSTDNSKGNVNVNWGCILFVVGCAGRLTVGGQLKSSGNLNIDGKLYVGTSNPAGDPPSPAPAKVRDISVAGTITTTGSNSRIETSNGGSIAADGVITVNNGVIVSDGSIASDTSLASNGGSGMTARINIVTRGAITGGDTITATTGTIASNSSITGNGARTAGNTISARLDLSGSGTKSAGAVLVGRDLSGGAVTASSGNIEVGGTLSGSAARSAANGRIAVKGALSITGALTAKSGILGGAAITTSGTSSVTITAGDLTAVGNITTTQTTPCAITGSVRAGGTVTFLQRGSNSNACSITGKLQANTNGSTSTTSTLSDHSSGSPTQVRVAGAVESKGGWNSTGRYRTISSATAIDPNPDKSNNPTLPASPTIVAPLVVPATTFQMIDPNADTYLSIDELYLRTGWIDLGTYTNWTGYTKLPPLSGGQCSFSYIRSLLEASGDQKIVIDATPCTGTLNLASWSSVTLRHDAVILVNRVSVALVPFAQVGADADHPRQLFIVQVDDDVTTRVGPAGGDPEPQPDCSHPGDNAYKINLTFAGWGGFSRWDDNVRVMLYSPCGVANGGGTFYTWEGHIYVANDNATKDVLASVKCKRMTVENTIDLPCSVNDFGEWGGMHTEAASTLGDRFRQSER